MALKQWLAQSRAEFAFKRDNRVLTAIIYCFAFLVRGGQRAATVKLLMGCRYQLATPLPLLALCRASASALRALGRRCWSSRCRLTAR